MYVYWILIPEGHRPMRQFYNIYIHKWQMAENTHRRIQNNRNTMEHKNIQNRSVSYIQSIGAYF